MDPVANTALIVAAARALESERDDRLFEDPFARALAGDDGFKAFDEICDLGDLAAEPLAIRTFFFDTRILSRVKGALRQVVILGAGLDARAFRLRWPEGVRLFEIEREEVLERKRARLTRARPRCERHAVVADLREDWCSVLVAHGFDEERPTLWVAEGLLVYFEEDAVRALLSRLTELSAFRSILLADLVDRSAFESSENGLPLPGFVGPGSLFRFGTDEPRQFFDSFGWDANATDAAYIGALAGRWTYAPPSLGANRSLMHYLVDATKHD